MLESDYTDGYSMQKAIYSGMIAGFSSGLIFGTLEEFYFSGKFRRSSFTSIILFKSGIYLSLIVLISMLSSVLFNTVLADRGLTDPAVWVDVYGYMTGEGFLNVFMLGTFILVVTIFLLEVSNKYGPGNLWKFATGQYYHPKEETRVFMFIDLRDSTTIAEDIGHVLYFEFIKEFFDDVTDPIMENYGEIYQYVGDEIVITWRENKGDYAIPCFHQIQEAIEKNRDKYQEKYGVVPSFRAGCHIGPATVGEIGIIKKEIIYSGDVLNTAARIRGLSDKYSEDLLCSEDYMKRYQISGYKNVGSVLPKGKRTEITIAAPE